MINRLTTILLITSLALIIGGAYVLVPSITEYRRTQSELRATQRNLLIQQQVNEDIRAHIFRLKTDDRTIEQTARDKFNYAYPNETIYDFTQPVGAGVLAQPGR